MESFNSLLFTRNSSNGNYGVPASLTVLENFNPNFKMSLSPSPSGSKIGLYQKQGNTKGKVEKESIEVSIQWHLPHSRSTRWKMFFAFLDV